MNTQRAFSQHRAHLSVPRLGTNRREGLRQDKSRKVLGGRTDQKAKDNNLLAKGAHVTITLLHAPFHWKHWNLDTLRVVAP
jgi:hypothetical protein